MLLPIQPVTTMNISLIIQAGIIIIRGGIRPGTTDMRMLHPELEFMKTGGAIQVSILPGGGDRHGTRRSILDMDGTVMATDMGMGTMDIMDLLPEAGPEISDRDEIVSWHAVLEADIMYLQCKDPLGHPQQVMYRQDELQMWFQETTLQLIQQILQGSTVHRFVNRNIRIK
jgi:hypothetical protein